MKKEEWRMGKLGFAEGRSGSGSSFFILHSAFE